MDQDSILQIEVTFVRSYGVSSQKVIENLKIVGVFEESSFMYV